MTADVYYNVELLRMSRQGDRRRTKPQRTVDRAKADKLARAMAEEYPHGSVIVTEHTRGVGKHLVQSKMPNRDWQITDGFVPETEESK